MGGGPIGHDIALAFRYARRFFSFIPADALFAELATWLAPHHRDHSFRYRKTGWRPLPIASEAAEIIIKTVDGVDPFVRHEFLRLRRKSSN